MFNKNIEIGFQSAVFHLCQQALVPLVFIKNKSQKEKGWKQGF